MKQIHRTHHILDEIIGVCKRAAIGDLEARIVPLPEDPRFARLSEAVNNLLDHVDAYVRESAAAMDHAAAEQFHRPVLTRGMHGAYRHAARTINRAAAKMKDFHDTNRKNQSKCRQLAATLANASQTVSAACHELSATTDEIARRTRESAEGSQHAEAESQKAREAVTAMAQATRQISSIVDLINQIADQTKLLALNATIEAARAGEAGKGFAVVAGEVKELSKETAAATSRIENQVREVVAASETVAQIIAGMAETVSTIAQSAAIVVNSLQEQGAAIDDISRQVSELHQLSSSLEASIDRPKSAPEDSATAAPHPDPAGNTPASTGPARWTSPRPASAPQAVGCTA